MDSLGKETSAVRRRISLVAGAGNGNDLILGKLQHPVCLTNAIAFGFRNSSDGVDCRRNADPALINRNAHITYNGNTGAKLWRCKTIVQFDKRKMADVDRDVRY